MVGETTATSGGWCIHGVPFGPAWSCGQCVTGQASNAPGGVTVTLVAWTPDKVDRVLFLLERIAKELETARLRR